MNQITVNLQFLKACGVCMGHNDIRYYLNGVFVEIMHRETRYVSTDGKRLLILRETIKADEPDQVPAHIIIPDNVVKVIKVNGMTHGQLHYPDDGKMAQEGVPCTLVGLKGADLAFKSVDGKFPDYDRVVRGVQTPDGKRADFDLQYLGDFAKAAQIAFGFKDRKLFPQVWHNGEGGAPVTVHGYGEFFGVIMPVRTMTNEYAIPFWICPEKVKAQAA